MNWLILSLVAILFWGIWGFLAKISGQYINSKSILIYSVLGNMLVSSILLFSMKFKLDTDSKGVTLAILGGVAGSVAVVSVLYALTKGKASIIVPLTAMYPVVTIFLSYIFLKETLTIKQIIGVLFAFAAVFLLAL